MPINNQKKERSLLKDKGISTFLIENGTFDERKIELEKLDLLIAEMNKKAMFSTEQSARIKEYEIISKNGWHELYEDIIKREA